MQFNNTPKEIAPMCEFACLVCLYKKKSRCKHRDNKEYCEDVEKSIVKFEGLVKEVLTEKMKPQTEEKMIVEKSKLYLCISPGNRKLYIIAKNPNSAKRLYFLCKKCRQRDVKVSYVDHYIDGDEPESIVYPNSTLASSYGIEY